MKADLAKLRSELRALMGFGGDDEDFSGYAGDFLRTHGAELLAIAEAVERAPVFAADLFSQDGRIVGVDLNKHGAERVRLLAIGEDG